MLDDCVGEEVDGLERMGSDEWIQLNVRVFKSNERESQLAFDNLEIRVQLGLGLGHAQLHLVQGQLQVAKVVPGDAGNR